jgi:hypothetical protein
MDLTCLPACVVAHIGSFVDFDTRRDCILAHRCLGSVMETFKGGSWRLRADADYVVKGQTLLRRKPRLTDMQLTFGPAADDGWSAVAERQSLELAEALARLPLSRVTLLRDETGRLHDDRWLIPLLRALATALPSHVQIDAKMHVCSMSDALDAVEPLFQRGRPVHEFTQVTLWGEFQNLTDDVVLRLEALSQSGCVQCLVWWTSETYSVSTDWGTALGKRALIALRRIAKCLIAKLDCEVAGVADIVHGNPDIMITDMIMTRVHLLRLAANDVLHSLRVQHIDMAAVVESLTDDLVNALRKRAHGSPQLVLHGNCLRHPSLCGFLRVLLSEPGLDLHVRVQPDSLTSNFVVRRALAGLDDAMRLRVRSTPTGDAVATCDLTLAELEERLRQQAGADPGLRRMCLMMGL